MIISSDIKTKWKYIVHVDNMIRNLNMGSKQSIADATHDTIFFKKLFSPQKKIIKKIRCFVNLIQYF